MLATECKVSSCVVHPAVPAGLDGVIASPRAERDGDLVRLGNRYLTAEIAVTSGVMTAITNRLTGERHPLFGDQLGFRGKAADGKPITWVNSGECRHPMEAEVHSDDQEATVTLTARQWGFTVIITYRLRAEHFWVERNFSVETEATGITLDCLEYGKLDAQRGSSRTLELGKYDRPRLLPLGEGGVFWGLGWWFYDVDKTCIYCNADIDYPLEGRLETEPWYVGIFLPEAGEAFPGWLWYKTFLRMRKEAYDRHAYWSHWNSGWGHWNIDVDYPQAEPYLALAKRLGVRAIGFGSGYYGKGMPEYIRLAREDEAAKRNIALCDRFGLKFGFLQRGLKKEEWEDPAVIAEKLHTLDEAVGEHFSAYHFDFFYLSDTFRAHRHAAQYFRAAHDKLAFTECHLGMALYGPQLQREVLLNHPNDLHGFDISPFSADWATFLGFRHSRREWQAMYQYLMPEYGLYYFLTHYSNMHARLYHDPEPQQFAYQVQSNCAISFNVHDLAGYRTALAGAAAFTPFYILGHLELTMPEADIVFTREMLDWVAEHADLIHLDRVCLETEEACVVSKLRGGRGLIFLLNYRPGERVFRLRLDLGVEGELRIRPVYPLCEEAYDARDGEEIAVTVAGESVVMLEVNGALRSLPPEDIRQATIDLPAWQECGDGWESTAWLPDLREELAMPSPPLPRELLSIDQFSDDPEWAAHMLAALGIEKAEELPVDVEWLRPSNFGRGVLPEAYLRACGFHDDLRVETWRIAPYAFADRIWLAWRPSQPVSMHGPWPTVSLNGVPLPLVPRVDYRPKDLADWTCPLFHADATDAYRHGETNTVTVSGCAEMPQGEWYFIAAGR